MTPSEFLAARKRLGLTQDGMAAALGVTNRCARHYEKGVHPISKPIQKLIAFMLKHGVAP